MADLSLSVLISRTSLALAALEINDSNYKISGSDFLGGQVVWDKTKVSSPFADGDVTTHRRRQNVQETVTVEVYGDNMADMQASAKELIEAFCQSMFTMTVTANSSATVYDCQAADYKIVISGPRYVANQIAIQFSVERSPLLVSGSI